MFRIFLRNKIFSNDSADAAEKASPAKVSRQRNRRLAERYNVTQHHLTMMNDQDILVIRDISPIGFSSDVSERAYLRLKVGDIYAARMRYLGEGFDLKIKLTWKADRAVGFALLDPSPTAISFLNRLLRPIAIANSMRQVNAAFMRGNKEAKVWFHGDFDTELFLWRDRDGQIVSWKLISGTEVIEWQIGHGISTGQIKQPTRGTADYKSLSAPEEVEARDPVPDVHRQQFATDLIMALNSKLRDEILGTITG